MTSAPSSPANAASCSRKSGLPSASSAIALAHRGRRAERVEQPLAIGLRQRLEPQRRLGARATAAAVPQARGVRGTGAVPARRRAARRDARSGRAGSPRPSGRRRRRRRAGARGRAPRTGSASRRTPRSSSRRARSRRGPRAGTASRIGEKVVPSPYGGQPADDEARLRRRAGERARAPAATCRCRSRRRRSPGGRRAGGGLAVGGAEPLELAARWPTSGVSWRRGIAVASGSTESSRNAIASLVLPLQRQRLELRRAHGVRRRGGASTRRATISPGGGGLLEPLADGDGVAADEAVAGGRIPGHDLAGVDPDPHLEVHVALTVELRRRTRARRRPRAPRAARRPRARPARRRPP